ncbi:hypothetical protein A5634_22480 [Mycobacterium asiaticum]|uniref:Uncharacterized protein n=1 Tax=Mycobacterium asiaticum TaxID=1790 RepID=A0A1A3P2Y0_MYCAS|nr:hypothetical protein A5634_22480 [Mycobacterium asiaticum]
MPDPGDVRCMPLFLRPRDGFLLGLQLGKNTIRMIFDNVVRNRFSITAFRPRFDENVGHGSLPFVALTNQLTHTHARTDLTALHGLAHPLRARAADGVPAVGLNSIGRN